MKVTIERTQNRFRRSINGAWIGGGSEVTKFQADDSCLKPGYGVSHGITVTWEDGVSESAFPFNGGAFTGYPPTVYPHDGRLAKLLLAA